MPCSGFLATWSGHNREVYARRFGQDGSPTERSFLVEDGTGDAFAIDGDGRFVVVEEAYGSGAAGFRGDYEYLKGWRTDASGQLNTGVVQFTDYADTLEFDFAEQFSPVVTAENAGDFVIAWSQTDYYDGHYGSVGERVYARRFDSNMEPIERAWLIDGHNGANIPNDIDSNPLRGFVVAWQFNTRLDPGYHEDEEDTVGIAATKVLNRSERSRPFEKVQPRYNAEHTDSAPRVSSNDIGDFVVVWERRGADTKVYAEAFNKNGSVSIEEFDVNMDGSSDAANPDAVMLADGSFIVVWEEVDRDGSGLGVFARRITPTIR